MKGVSTRRKMGKYSMNKWPFYRALCVCICTSMKRVARARALKIAMKRAMKSNSNNQRRKRAHASRERVRGASSQTSGYRRCRVEFAHPARPISRALARSTYTSRGMKFERNAAYTHARYNRSRGSFTSLRASRFGDIFVS